METNECGGGQGEVLASLEARANKADLTLIRRAISERWPIAPKDRELLVARMVLLLDASDDPRMHVAAAKVLVAADSVNARRELGERTPVIPIEHQTAEPDNSRLRIVEHALACLLADRRPAVVIDQAAQAPIVNGHTNGHYTNGHASNGHAQ